MARKKHLQPETNTLAARPGNYAPYYCATARDASLSRQPCEHACYGTAPLEELNGRSLLSGLLLHQSNSIGE